MTEETGDRRQESGGKKEEQQKKEKVSLSRSYPDIILEGEEEEEGKYFSSLSTYCFCCTNDEITAFPLYQAPAESKIWVNSILFPEDNTKSGYQKYLFKIPL